MSNDRYTSDRDCECDRTVVLINLRTPFSGSNTVLEGMPHTKAVDNVVATGVGLARDVVLHLLGDMRFIQRDELSLCLRNSVVEIMEKHSILFTSFAKRLAVTPERTSELFLGVSSELFHNNSVTWSGIIALYALAGRLALYYQQKNMHRLARSIPQHMARCIARKVAPFVKRNGGWKQLCVEFPLKEDPSGQVWMSLLITGAGLGLVAALRSAYLYFPLSRWF